MKGGVLVLLLGLLRFTLQCCLVPKVDARAQQMLKMDSAIPVTTLSPPEGNTTFLGGTGGTTWCVARGGASQFDLQSALDWACGLGMTDCNAIQAGGPCFEPNTLTSHASYAFNSYYQQNGNNDIACNFGGTAVLTGNNPSYGKCTYATSGRPGDLKASAAAVSRHNGSRFWWEISILLLLLYLRRS
nr:glucan endo-1,3-beta-glucosidase 13-like isoform X1 [Ipomoea trifida]